MNLKIKFRESFRPFAPSVMQERVHEYFAMEPGQASPYMLLVAPVQEQRRVAPSGQQGETNEDCQCAAPQGGDDRLALRNQVRSDVPAITHVDYSARVQTVDRHRNPLYHQLLDAFRRKTGCATIINTSFNIRGEPIVCTPAHAYRCFLATNMDALVMGHYLLLKTEQCDAPRHETSAYLASFQLD